jgi:hypothetical protein
VGQLVLGLAGAAASTALGFGPTWGWGIGSALGGMLSRPDKQRSQQSIMDLKVVGTDYGQAIPYARGTVALAGQVWWNSDRIPVEHTSTSGGGKGGGAPESESTTYTYKINVLYGFADIEGAGLGRIWDNGELIYNPATGTTQDTPRWDRITFYDGDAAQLPDPTYEAAVELELGADHAPAYRGRTTIFIEGLNLGESGQMRNLIFEIIIDGDAGDNYEVTSGWHTGTTFGVEAAVSWDSNNSRLWINDTVLNPNSVGGVGRFGYYDFTAAAFTGLAMDSTYRTVLSNQEPCYAANAVPEWGVFLGEASTAGGVETTLYYDLTTGTLLGNSTDILIGRGGTKGFVACPDPARSRVLISNDSGDAFRLYSADETGFPMVALASTTVGAPWFWVVDNDGNFWGHNPSEGFKKCALVGASIVETLIPFPADVVAHGYHQHGCLQYDTNRNRLYFLNEETSGGESIGQYVWYLDCSTHDFDHVNGSALTYGGGTGGSILHYEPELDRLVVNVGNTMHAIDPDTGTALHSKTVTESQSFRGGQLAGASGVVWGTAKIDADSPPVGYGEWRFNVTESDAPTVQQVVSDLCVRAGLTTAQIDVTELSSISRTVNCWPLAQIVSTRTALELLSSIYFFEMTCGSKLKFVPRGGSSVATIPYIDLGAAMVGEESPEPLELIEANDAEIPSQIIIKFINIDNEYQPGAEPSDRLVSALSSHVEEREVGIGLALHRVDQPARALPEARADRSGDDHGQGRVTDPGADRSHAGLLPAATL